MSRFQIGLLCIFLWIGHLAYAPFAQATFGSLAQISQVQRFRIQDDISILLAEDHRVPLFKVVLVFPFGTTSPWVQQHHIEHMMKALLTFKKTSSAKGTPSTSEDKPSETPIPNIHSFADNEGGYIILSGHRKSLPIVGKLIRGILRHNDIDPSTLFKNSLAKNLRFESMFKVPVALLKLRTLEIFYPEGDTRLIDMTKPKEVKDSVEEICKARDTYIRLPGRVVAISGDVTTREARRIALDMKLPPPLTILPEGLYPTFFPFRTDRKDTEFPVEDLRKVFFSYAREGLYLTHPDYVAFSIADHILVGRPTTSLLMKALRQAHGDSYEVNASGGNDNIAPSVYYITTSTKAENAKVVERTLRQSIAQFAAQGITQEELQEARDYFRGSEAFRHNSAWQMLAQAMYEKYYGWPPGHISSLRQKIQHIPLEEINRFIRNFYDPRQFTMIKLIPK